MESVLSPYYSTHTHVAALSSKEFVAIYYDGGNGDAGVSVAGSVGQYSPRARVAFLLQC